MFKYELILVAYMWYSGNNGAAFGGPGGRPTNRTHQRGKADVNDWLILAFGAQPPL